MLICDRCGNVINESDAEIIHEKDYINCGCGKICIRDDEFLEDCFCGGTFVDATECEFCGEWFNGEGNVCESCINEYSTFGNALKMGAETDCIESIKINGYLAYEFSENQINEILERELRQANEIAQLKYKDYLKSEIDYFLNWLSE